MKSISDEDSPLGMMPDRQRNALEKVAGLYTRNLEELGPGPRSVGWRDQESHHLRLRKLLQVVEPAMASQGFTINDLGCGYGALFDYLVEHGQYRLQKYYGYDISPKMLEACRSRIKDPRAEFHLSRQATYKADYGLVCGTYNVRMDADDASWSDYIKSSLLDLAAQCERGIAFNLLTTHVDWRNEQLFYADPLEFFEFCRRNLSRYVTLLHDYPLYEWTMLVRWDDAS